MMRVIPFAQRSPVLVLLFGLGSGAMQSTTADQAGWNYEVTPYLLAAGLDGSAGVKGLQTDVDASFSDLWDVLDLGLMGLLTAERGPWTLGFEGIYFKVGDQASKTATGPLGQVSVSGAVDVSSSVTVLQPSVMYRILDDRTQVDLVGALRYTRLSLDLDVTITATDPPLLPPGAGSSVSGSESWIDAVVGARVIHPISDRWSLLGYADVGAGGADLTYQIVAGANWTLNDRLTAKAGYRYVYWDYEDDGVVWDLSASGPYLGLGFAF